jgi:hypothetical protein
LGSKKYPNPNAKNKYRATTSHANGFSAPDRIATKVTITPMASYTNKARIIAHLASDSCEFLANHVSIKLPIIDAPYSLAAKTPPAASVAPKIEYIKLGTSKMGTPRHKHTIALIINKVFNFIAVLLSLINFQIVIIPLFIYELIIRILNSPSKLNLVYTKVKFLSI